MSKSGDEMLLAEVAAVAGEAIKLLREWQRASALYPIYRLLNRKTEKFLKQVEKRRHETARQDSAPRRSRERRPR